MFKNIKNKLKKNIEIIGLVSLIIIAAVSTTYSNYSKKINNETYDSFIDNIYFKKTINYIVENLEPKYKKIKHKINSGETFDKILEIYPYDRDD